MCYPGFDCPAYDPIHHLLVTALAPAWGFFCGRHEAAGESVRVYTVQNVLEAATAELGGFEAHLICLFGEAQGGLGNLRGETDAGAVCEAEAALSTTEQGVI